MMTEAIRHVRHFNRSYTKQIGVLTGHLYRSKYSLTEVRVLYEIAHRDSPMAVEIGADLGIDRGYMSRILRRFERHGIVRRRISPSDARASLLSLTPKGKRIFQPLEVRADEEIAALLNRVTLKDRQRLLTAMSTIEEILAKSRQ